jgi:hypothetical protein
VVAKKRRALDVGSGLFPLLGLDDEGVPVFAAKPRGHFWVLDAQRFLREDRARHAVERWREVGKREAGRA